MATSVYNTNTRALTINPSTSVSVCVCYYTMLCTEGRPGKGQTGDGNYFEIARHDCDTTVEAAAADD